MDDRPFKARAYLKEGCPFSFKYLLFMAEARLLDHIEIVRCDPKGDEFERIKAILSAGTGRPATFPTVEIAPDRYLSDSDRLIEHYARANAVRPSALAAWSFYERTIFPELRAIHENE